MFRIVNKTELSELFVSMDLCLKLLPAQFMAMTTIIKKAVNFELIQNIGRHQV